jgi:hypothetical protein
MAKIEPKTPAVRCETCCHLHGTDSAWFCGWRGLPTELDHGTLCRTYTSHAEYKAECEAWENG